MKVQKSTGILRKQTLTKSFFQYMSNQFPWNNQYREVVENHYDLTVNQILVKKISKNYWTAR